MTGEEIVGRESIMEKKTVSLRFAADTAIIRDRIFKWKTGLYVYIAIWNRSMCEYIKRPIGYLLSIICEHWLYGSLTWATQYMAANLHPLNFRLCYQNNYIHTKISLSRLHSLIKSRLSRKIYERHNFMFENKFHIFEALLHKIVRATITISNLTT